MSVCVCVCVCMCVCLVTQLCPTLCNSLNCSPPGLPCPWDFSGKNTRVGCHFLLQGNLPDSGIKPTSPAFSALAGGFFTTAPPGKPITKDSCLLFSSSSL